MIHLKFIWQQCYSGYSSLMIAVLKRRPEMVKLLLEYGADTEAINDEGQ